MLSFENLNGGRVFHKINALAYHLWGCGDEVYEFVYVIYQGSHPSQFGSSTTAEELYLNHLEVICLKHF